MRNASFLALLLCSMMCIVAGYKENVTLGTVAVCCLFFSWIWSRRRFLETFRHAKQERRLGPRIKHQAKEGGGSDGHKPTKSKSMCRNRPAQS